MSVEPTAPANATAAAAPPKKTLGNETGSKIKYIFCQMAPEMLRMAYPDTFEKPFSSEHWTVAPGDIHYRNTQALAEKKTLGVSHLTLATWGLRLIRLLQLSVSVLSLIVLIQNIMLVGGITYLSPFLAIAGITLLLIWLAYKLYFLTTPPPSKNPNYIEEEAKAIELMERRPNSDPTRAQLAMDRKAYEAEQKLRSGSQPIPAASAPVKIPAPSAPPASAMLPAPSASGKPPQQQQPVQTTPDTIPDNTDD